MPTKKAPSEKRAADLEREKEVIQFFTETHRALHLAKREARAVLSAREGDEAVLRATKEKLPLGDALDYAVNDFEQSLADEYTYVDPFGVVVGKREIVNRLRTGESIFEDLNKTEFNVRIIGDIALVANRVNVKGELEGQEISGSYYESHTLQRQDEGWTLLASQLTRIQEVNELFVKAVDCDAAFLAPGAEVINPPPLHQ